MREQSNRAGSSSERADFRPAHGKPRTGASRSRRSANLGRLGEELGMDLLGAALGLSEQTLRILVEGRDQAREEQYSAHLATRFKDAGIAPAWLDRTYAAMAPEHLSKLRNFAAASSTKSPIRRSNFRRLAAAFDGREDVLADALEMVPSAVSNVAEGRLEFDDGRFGHINPRLVRAGFPDGWLEQAEPDLTDAMLISLEQLATDDYERKFEEAEALKQSALEKPVQAHVGPALAPVVAKPVQPVAVPADTSKETIMATANQRQTKAPQQQPTFSPTPPQFKAGGLSGAAKPMAHPSSAGAKLPRSVLASGRSVGAATPGKPSAASASAAAAQKSTQSSASAPAHSPAAPAPERRTLAPRGSVTKEVSLARAEALEKLLADARRGVKVTLWRDILGSSLPFWGNIRRGAVLFRDDLAEGVVEAMGLPTGWLDNPSFPPATMAAWVTDPAAQVPTALEANAARSGTTETPAQNAAPTPAPTPAPAKTATGAAAKRDAAKPFARKTAPAPAKVTMTKPPASPPVFQPTAFSAPAAAARPAAPANAVGTFAAAGAALTAAPASEQGPLCQALISIITAKHAAGTFTEADALKLINTLVAQ